MKIIIYGSQYGTTKKYAEELAKRTIIESESYEDVADIDKYNTVVYIGGLYAGGVLGMKKTLARISSRSRTDRPSIVKSNLFSFLPMLLKIRL